MFKLSSKDRLIQWKIFRKTLNSLSLDTSIHKTQELFESCPFSPYFLNIDDVNSWPDPWTLILDNYYCDIAKVLGIVYTLHLTDHKLSICPEIRSYYDTKSRVYYHIAYLCQGKYVLNLIENEVVNKEQINQNLILKYCYTAVDLKLDQY